MNQFMSIEVISVGRLVATLFALKFSLVASPFVRFQCIRILCFKITRDTLFGFASVLFPNMCIQSVKLKLHPPIFSEYFLLMATSINPTQEISTSLYVSGF